MRNENVFWRRYRRELLKRWSAEDYPGAKPRFQMAMLAKDIAIFVLLPIFAVLIYVAASGHSAGTSRKHSKTEETRPRYQTTDGQSQIIEFRGNGRGQAAARVTKKAPGGLVRVRLLNVVETYSTAPVHAQILDSGLGASMRGGVLIGDASPDTNFERISISFRFARDPARENVAFPITARALSLDGTFGLNATKKESFLTRSVLGSASSATQDVQGKIGGTNDFGQILLRALTAGLAQEFGSGTQVERNRAQVLMLPQATEFFAELTDYFGGASK